MDKKIDFKQTGPVWKKLGNIVSVNASLPMFLADAKVAQYFRGVLNGEEDEDGECTKNSHWEKLLYALGYESQEEYKSIAAFEIEEGKGAAINLRVGVGIADVWKMDKTIVLFEGWGPDEEEADKYTEEDWELFKNYLAEPTAKQKPDLVIDISSGLMVIVPCMYSAEDVGELIGKKLAQEAQPCGEGEDGIIIAVEPGNYGVFIDEDEAEGAWGSGRRVIITSI